MGLNIEAIIWYVFLIDAVFANLTALFWKDWYNKHKLWSKIFPITGWWTLVYLALVIWVGSSLYRLGIL